MRLDELRRELEEAAEALPHADLGDRVLVDRVVWRHNRNVVVATLATALLLVVAGAVAIAAARNERSLAPAQQQTKEVEELTREDSDAEVYLKSGATDDEIEAVRALLEANERVVAFMYVSREDQLAEFRRTFASVPDLIESVEAGDLPASFRLRLDNASDSDSFARALEREDRVEAVVTYAYCRALGWGAYSAEDLAWLRSSDANVDVFLALNVTDDQIAGLQAAFDADAAVGQIEFVSQEESFEEFRRTFQDNPELLDTVQVGDLPASFRVQVVDPDTREAWADKVDLLPGVDAAEARPMPAELGTHSADYLALLRANDASVDLYLALDATDDQIAALRAELEADATVGQVEFVSPEDALEELRRAFQDDPELLDAVHVDDLPASFRVELIDPATRETWAADARFLQGVKAAEARAMPAELLRCPPPS